MKFFLLLPLLTALAFSSAQAQQTTVKTKAKPAGQASVKAKSTVSTAGKAKPAKPAPEPEPADVEPEASVVEARANSLTENMRTGLGLSPAQVEKVRVINTTSVRNVESARLRYRNDPRRMQATIENVGISRIQLLKDVLTPNQFDRYQRKREEKMGIPNVQGATGNQAPGLGGSGGE